MSRAFINEDAQGPEHRYILPARDDPDYDRSAASVLLEGADRGDSYGAELATGYQWGEPKLKPYVQEMLAQARELGDERLMEIAERFLQG